MKICIFCNQFFPVIGGAERQAQLMAKKLQERGHDVFVLTGQLGAETPLKDNIDGIPVLRYRTMLFGSERRQGRFTSFIWVVSLIYALFKMRNNYDIIHANLVSRQGALCAFVGKLLGKPLLIKVANTKSASEILLLSENKQVYGRFFFKLLRFSTYYIATTQFMKKELIEVHGIEKHKIKVIPNGVDIDSFSQVQGRVCSSDHKSGESEKGPLVLYVGRLTEVKNPEVILIAARKLHDEGISCHFMFCGDGLLKEKLLLLVSQLGLEKEVTILGNVRHDKIKELLLSSEIFILPSKAEGLSNALLEAMSAKVACVCSNIESNLSVLSSVDNAMQPISEGAFRELETGLVVSPNEPEAIANAIKYYLMNEELRKVIVDNAFKHVAENYSIEHVVEKYEKLYADILKDEK